MSEKRITTIFNKAFRILKHAAKKTQTAGVKLFYAELTVLASIMRKVTTSKRNERSGVYGRFSKIVCALLGHKRIISRLTFSGEIALIIGDGGAVTADAAKHIAIENDIRTDTVCGGIDNIAVSLTALDITEKTRDLTIVACDIADAAELLPLLSPEYVVCVGDRSERYRNAPPSDALTHKISELIPRRSAVIVNSASLWNDDIKRYANCKKTVSYEPYSIFENEECAAEKGAALLLAIEAGARSGKARLTANGYGAPPIENEFEQVRYGAVGTKNLNVCFVMKKREEPMTSAALERGIERLRRDKSAFTAVIAASAPVDGYGWLYSCNVGGLINAERVIVCGAAAHIIALRLRIAGLRNVEIKREIGAALKKAMGRRSYVYIIDHKLYKKTKLSIFKAISRTSEFNIFSLVKSLLKRSDKVKSDEKHSETASFTPVYALKEAKETILLPSSFEENSAELADSTEREQMAANQTQAVIEEKPRKTATILNISAVNDNKKAA